MSQSSALGLRSISSVTGVKRSTVPATMTPVGSCGAAGAAAAAATDCPVRPWPTRAVVAASSALSLGGPPFICNRYATMFVYVSAGRPPGLSGGIVERACKTRSLVARLPQRPKNSGPASSAFGSWRRLVPWQLAQVWSNAARPAAACSAVYANASEAGRASGARSKALRRIVLIVNRPRRDSERGARRSDLARQQPAPEYGVVRSDAAFGVQLYIEAAREQCVALLAVQVDVARDHAGGVLRDLELGDRGAARAGSDALTQACARRRGR